LFDRILPYPLLLFGGCKQSGAPGTVTAYLRVAKTLFIRCGGKTKFTWPVRKDYHSLVLNAGDHIDLYGFFRKRTLTTGDLKDPVADLTRPVAHTPELISVLSGDTSQLDPPVFSELNHPPRPLDDLHLRCTSAFHSQQLTPFE